MRITDIKHCGRCKCHKPRPDFSDSTVKKDGKQDWCRQCMKLYRAVKKASKEVHVKPNDGLECACVCVGGTGRCDGHCNLGDL